MRPQLGCRSLAARADACHPFCNPSALFIIYTITSLETWGDTAATIEASKLPTDGGPLQIRRQKGALLNDAISGVFSGLAGCLPLTTFAQNNGIISLTAVARAEPALRAAAGCWCWASWARLAASLSAFPIPFWVA